MSNTPVAFERQISVFVTKSTNISETVLTALLGALYPSAEHWARKSRPGFTGLKPVPSSRQPSPVKQTQSNKPSQTSRANPAKSNESSQPSPVEQVEPSFQRDQQPDSRYPCYLSARILYGCASPRPVRPLHAGCIMPATSRQASADHAPVDQAPPKQSRRARRQVAIRASPANRIFLQPDRAVRGHPPLTILVSKIITSASALVYNRWLTQFSL
ncbi:hypothetical protein Thiowin_00511 [Thiorhodovibrio winogradskyi]|uniref:Transposase n=1 Tax=Thiorhodovibrio winogradskyi TaxID=77007 RepID=A0ABZ0S510_9GAMM